jgi:hypothetical protein
MTVLACVLFALAFEVCELCAPGEPEAVLCAAHQSEQDGVIARHRPILESGNLEQRLAAMVALAKLNRDHENAPSRTATRALATGLSDPDTSLRMFAALALTKHQHVDEATAALDARLRAATTRIDALVGPLAFAVKASTTRASAGRSGTSKEALLGLREAIDDRGALVLTLASFSTLRAEEGVLRTFKEWDLPKEMLLASTLLGYDKQYDPLRSASMFGSLASIHTRRTATALADAIGRVESAYAKYQHKTSKKSGKQGDVLDAKALQRLGEELSGSMLGMNVLGTTVMMRHTWLEAVKALGQRGEFPDPPGAGAKTDAWVAWVRKHQTKLAPNLAPKPAK